MNRKFRCENCNKMATNTSIFHGGLWCSRCIKKERERIHQSLKEGVKP